MWANENWTRRWDGSEDQVLISQDYRDTDEPALLAEFGRHFADPRYIRVQGRPLLMVYRPRLIPATAETIERWRGAFRQRHAEDPIFVMAQSFTDCDPRPFGLDGAIEFPPHKLVRGLGLQQPEEVLDPDFTAQVYDYEQVAAASLAEPAPDYPLIKTAVPGWDNDARRQGAGLVLHGSTPARYQAWLEGLIRRAAQHRFFGESFVCINAWNEWAEGAYLEPDVHFGAAYLNATARAVAGLAQASEAGRLLLVGHDAFPAGAQLLLLHLGRQLRRAHGVEIAFLLLDGGELEPAYAEAGPLAITRDDAALAERAAALRAQGFRAAIVNSAASARACAALQRAGLDCTLLVHELPRLLQARGLAGPAAEAAAIARQVVFPAEIVRDGFAATTGRAPAASTILPQGIYRPAPFSEARRQELRAQLGVAPDAILALGVGYADLRKGFDLFLQLWHAARRADRIVHLCWIGRRDPLLDGHLAAEIEAAEASRTFHMPGYREDAAEWFSAADVHVLTSREDPFPSVVLEAMSAGVPSIAFEGSGGIPELLRRHDAGTVVPMGDVPGMATALLALAGGAVEPRRTRLTRLAREEFSFGRYAERLLHLARPDVPRISVAVPSHNYARFLRQRLASIFAQTHPVLEVIVLDDASTDDSVAVARAAAEEWGREIHIVESPANSGSVFRQWQRAVELARGDWLWIAEADDASEPGFLERLAGALTAAPGAVLGFTDSRAIDEAGQPVMESYKPYYRQCGGDLLAASGSFAGRDFLRACLATHNLILNASAVLWRRDALCAAFARCATDLGQFRMAGDWRLYAEALDAADAHVAYVAEPLNVHRRHSGSVTHRLDRDAHLDEIARMHALLAGRLGHDPGLRARQARVIEELADRPGHVVRPARSGEGIRLRVVA